MSDRRGKNSARAATVAVATVAALLLTGVAWAAGLAVTTARLSTATLATPAFYPTSVTVTRKDTAGAAPAAGDIVRLNFSLPVSTNSICPGVTDLAVQTIRGVTVTLTNGVAGNDTVTVTAGPAECPAPKVGSVNLGSTAYLAAGSATFTGSSLTLTTSPSDLAITLGVRSGAAPSNVTGATVVRYVPDPLISDRTGRLIRANTAASTSGQQF